MSPSLASLLCAIFIVWLFKSDVKHNPRVSPALWIPILWTCIISSRSVSFWLGSGSGQMDMSGFPEDSPMDGAVYLLLILAGLVVLIKRRVTWASVYRQNKWISLFFLYLGLSVLWSPDLFVSTKRWVKEMGHVVMILVVFSESDPVQAARAFLARCAYLLIPLSVLVVKYYPWISRTYDSWTFEPCISGICSDKNLFGMTLFASAVPLVWLSLGASDPDVRKKDPAARLRYFALLGMAVWLLVEAHSATAQTCTMLASAVLLGFKFPSLRSRAQHLGIYLSLIAILVVVLQSTGAWDALWNGFVRMLGREPEMTGRTPIWHAVLKEDINPLFGTGFYSFWTIERARRVAESAGLFYLLNEAHDGYIETYLNSGLVGLTLLVVVIATSFSRYKKVALLGFGLASLRLAFIIAIVLYNVTESAFDRLTPVRFALLFAIIDWRMPATLGQGATYAQPGSNEDTMEPATC